MGGGGSGSSNNSLHNEARVAAQKFDSDEIHVLQKTWQDLADRSTGKGIDKDTFLQYFPLNGLLGERLFAQFDSKKNGSIDFDDFITGLASICRGTMDEKIHFIFNMYDVSHDNTVSKQDLATLLNQIPKGTFGYTYDPYFHTPQPGDIQSRERSPSQSSQALSEAPGQDGTIVRENSKEVKEVGVAGIAAAPSGLERTDSLNYSATNSMVGIDKVAGTPRPEDAVPTDSDYEDVDLYTNHDMVEKAFAECDLKHEGRLTYEEFKMWVERTPAIMEYIESILPYNGPKDLSTAHHTKKDNLPHLRRIASRLSMSSAGRSGSSAADASSDIFNLSNHQQLRQRTMSMRQMTPGSRHTHNLSQHNLTINMSNLSNAPNSPLGPHTPHIHTPLGMSQHGPSTVVSGLPPMKDGPSLSRTSSFGFAGSSATPMHGMHDSSTHTGPMPGEYNLMLNRTMASPSVDGSQAFDHDNEETARIYLIQAMEVTQNETLRHAIHQLIEDHLGGGVITVGRTDSAEAYRTVVSMEDYLWKKGKSLFHMLNKRYYLLSGNCMYYYSHKNDVRPKGVIFLTGFIIDRVKDDDMALKGYYGFEIVHQEMTAHGGPGHHHNHEKRVLYCRSEDDRERWVSALQHAAHVVPIEDDYVIGKELGRGRFSIVCDCVHKITGVHCAVKIIDKSTIEPEEKGLLRTEIAVLKLVNHPNIIRMEGLYESKTHIYIVMEKLNGGELFERIVGRPRFSEQEAAKLLRPLLESVAYLHDLGIVHRDLKPENILCGEELEDLKIADFGLSKMVLPKEKMDSACGTLSYVAPEVLTMQGYGKEADLWSVGVIMFLILCGKLPFDGEDHNEIIRSTIQADLKVNPAVWGKLSEDARNLITALLNKNPKDRITARDALRHPFLVTNNPHKPRAHPPIYHHAHDGLVRSASKESLSGLSATSAPPTSAPGLTHQSSVGIAATSDKDN